MPRISIRFSFTESSYFYSSLLLFSSRGGKADKVLWEISYLYYSECGLGVPCFEILRHTLNTSYLDRMCLHPGARYAPSIANVGFSSINFCGRRIPSRAAVVP